MQETQPITTATLAVVGVEVVEAIPEKARRFAGPFYPDEIELLRQTLKGLRTRSAVVVAPSDHANAVDIYRKS